MAWEVQRTVPISISYEHSPNSQLSDPGIPVPYFLLRNSAALAFHLKTMSPVLYGTNLGNLHCAQGRRSHARRDRQTQKDAILHSTRNQPRWGGGSNLFMFTPNVATSRISSSERSVFPNYLTVSEHPKHAQKHTKGNATFCRSSSQLSDSGISVPYFLLHNSAAMAFHLE